MRQDKRRKNAGQNYPQMRKDNRLMFDDMDSLENYFSDDDYEETVEILKEGKRLGARRL